MFSSPHETHFLAILCCCFAAARASVCPSLDPGLIKLTSRKSSVPKKNTESEAARPENSAWEGDHLSSSGWHAGPCSLKGAGAHKICRGSNVLHVSIIALRVPSHGTVSHLEVGSKLRYISIWAKSDFHPLGLA